MVQQEILCESKGIPNHLNGSSSNNPFFVTCMYVSK